MITAGPTWVEIDSVRIISNIATGVTGVLLARQAAAQGARVTLVMGSCGEYNLNKSTRIIRFHFFNELKNILKRELKNNKYDIVIHSAAVSDFKPRKLRGKINSAKGYDLELKPLPKIIYDIRRLARYAKLVMFKLEPGVSDKILINRAKEAGIKSGADLIVANRLNPYRAFIIDKEDNQIKAQSKQGLAKKLIKVLDQDLKPKRYTLYAKR